MSEIMSVEEWVSWTPLIDPHDSGVVARWDRLRDHDRALRKALADALERVDDLEMRLDAAEVEQRRDD